MRKFRVRIGGIGVPIRVLDTDYETKFHIIDGGNRYMLFDSYGVNDKIRAIKSFSTSINNGKFKFYRVHLVRNDIKE